MIIKKLLKFKLKEALVGGFFVIIGLLGLLSVPVLNSATVYAVPEAEKTLDGGSGIPGKDDCSDTVGPVSWIVCTTTETVAKATDYLYDTIEQFLVVNPILIKNDSSVHKIWEYIKGLTNIIFIIFVLVVVYSQITGLGISNYGIKKALPKLIVTAVLVNISFVICQVAVDASNIIGDSLRGIFTSVIENSEVAIDYNAIKSSTTWADMYSAIAGVGAVAGVGLMFGVGSGSIWMLIPAVLGALVAVLTGLATIALRQAVVALLVMISPLAMVANILPNTEQWFKKWKDLLFKMLIFYPAFSLLFGASALAGYAIMLNAVESGNAIGYIIGAMVQAFPLFFSWKLMKMSGTFLGGINAKLNSLAAGGLAKNRAWAESRRDLTKARSLERGIMPSAYLMNFLNKRKTAREDETKSINDSLKAGYVAYGDALDLTKDGRLSRRGQRRYKRQELTSRYTQFSQQHKSNFDEGFANMKDETREYVARARNDLIRSRGAYLSTISGSTYDERIKLLDKSNADASDDLKAEMARAREIEYNNTKGYFDRIKSAQYAYDDNRARLKGDNLHTEHLDETADGAAYVLDNPEHLERYNRLSRIMGNNPDGVQTILNSAASDFNAQSQIRKNMFKIGSSLTVPTQDVINHLRDLISRPDRLRNIDAILGGISVLNQRGDTDETGNRIGELMTREFIEDLAGEAEKLYLGSYAQQAISNFTMFEVKDADPPTRRFGKYLNMQTAALYNRDGKRKRRDVSWHEYVNSEYVEHDDDGNVVYDDDGKPKIVKTRGMEELLLGTSYSGVERTTYKAQTERIRAESRDFDDAGNIKEECNFDKYLNKLEGVWKSIRPNVIGDHLSYASGSEQVIALKKDLTGINDDHLFNWKYFLGEQFEDADWGQRAKLLETLYGNVRKFLGGHVPSQIMKTKSDMLSGYEDLFALLDEVTYTDDNGKERVDPELLRIVDERRKKDVGGNKYNHDAYLAEHKEGISKRLLGSYTKTAKDGFYKMRNRGLASEAKDKMLGYWEEYFNEFDEANARKSKAKRENNDLDDGGALPESHDDEYEPFTDGKHNGARLEIENIYEGFLGRGYENAVEYFEAIRFILEDYAKMGKDTTSALPSLEVMARVSSVDDFHRLIISTFFA